MSERQTPDFVASTRAAKLIRYHLQNVNICESERDELAAYADQIEAKAVGPVEAGGCPVPSCPFLAHACPNHAQRERIVAHLDNGLQITFSDDWTPELDLPAGRRAVLVARMRFYADQIEADGMLLVRPQRLRNGLS